jgi:3-phenylpropionate/trans-cinnamate dioxygenase ferredoxin reductase subunit
MNDTVVIVGAGHAAGQAVASLKQKKYAGRIVVVGEEPWHPYQRPPLSKKFLAGELPAERLALKPQNFYDDSSIEMVLNTRVTEIDRDNKRLHTAKSRQISYDKLILAQGSRPRPMAVPGSGLSGVHYLRDIADVISMQKRIGPDKRIVIVGAGYIGLEVAAVTRTLGMQVTVVEMQDRVMSRVVSPAVSTFYTKEHRDRGVEILLSASVDSIEGKTEVRAVRTSDGRLLPADLVLIGIGVQPNVELAEDAGLAVGNGIIVDDRCRTLDADIFAIGDCTNHPNELLGRRLRLESVHNALEQAKTAAANIVGEEIQYNQVPWFWSDQYDLKLQIAGLSLGYDDYVIRGNPVDRSFACLYLQEGTLIAADAINSPRDFVQSKPIIADKCKVDPGKLADSDIALKDARI